MKQNRVQRQAASAVVRAPTVEEETLRRDTRFLMLSNRVHQQIASDLEESPEMMEPDLPVVADQDAWRELMDFYNEEHPWNNAPTIAEPRDTDPNKTQPIPVLSLK